MATRNLGQVAGLWIGTTPPTNTDLIWLDTSLNPAVHKVYANGGWNNLAQNIISTIGYANLKNLAQTTGLTLGSWYKITDNSVAYRNNVLAYAITSQRIHYVANNGNIVIDDLSSSSLAEFRVPCINNLLIDGITGDWSNNQLNFNFTEATPSNAADYFLFGKRLVNSVYQFAKFKISSFISSVTGNDLQWNNGLYINLSTLLNNRYDQVGGVTAYNTYSAKIALVDASLQTLSENYQHLISGYTDGNNVVHPDGIIDEKIADATSSAAIIGDGTSANPGKTLPSLDTTLTSGMNNILVGDNLRKIASKCQGWFNNLKKAFNIYLENYSAQTVQGYPASGDDIQTAVAKIGWWLNHITKGVIESDFIAAIHSITPGVSTVQDWMENAQYQLNTLNGFKLFKYDAIIDSMDALNAILVEGTAQPGDTQWKRYIPSSINSILIKGSWIYQDGIHQQTQETSGIYIAQRSTPLLIEFDPSSELTVKFANLTSASSGTIYRNFLRMESGSESENLTFVRGNGAKIIVQRADVSQSVTHVILFSYINNISGLKIIHANGDNSVGSVFASCYRVDGIIGSDTNDKFMLCYIISNCVNLYFVLCFGISNCVSCTIFLCNQIQNCSNCIIGDAQYVSNCVSCTFNSDYNYYITNCDGTFLKCYFVSTCHGDFTNCKGMIMCRGTIDSNCAVDFNGSTTPENTAAGGWNAVTVRQS